MHIIITNINIAVDTALLNNYALLMHKNKG
jgi:hypothetical protein